jgi:hypothetical protein
VVVIAAVAVFAGINPGAAPGGSVAAGHVNQPATACTPAVRSLLGRENSSGLSQGVVSVWTAGTAAP